MIKNLQTLLLAVVALCLAHSVLPAQSEFPFREKKERKNIVSLHASFSQYFDGVPFFLETISGFRGRARILPSGIDYQRMLDGKNGLLFSASVVPGGAAWIGENQYRKRWGGIFGASYLRNCLDKKGVDLYGLAGMSFMNIDEELVHRFPLDGESHSFHYFVRDLGVQAGLRLNIALPLGFRLSWTLQHTEYLKLFGNQDRNPDEFPFFPRFTRRRLALMVGLGGSF